MSDTPMHDQSAPQASAGFVPPPYPYDRLDQFKPIASAMPGGLVDLSIGTPCDPPPAAVVAALANSNAERGYPQSIGSVGFRTAAQGWIRQRFDVDVQIEQIAACVGTKEFVATTAQFLRLRHPARDTVLYPSVAYPTYEMSATLAGCRAVPVALAPSGGLDLSSIAVDDAARALMLWVNSPSNPTGALDDLGAAAQWGRSNDVPVFSDECYAEFTWEGPPRTILEHGSAGVVAVHSLSKRSNLAGLRVGFFAGDTDLVHYLQEVRKHTGLMVPGPVQAAAIVAWGDSAHVDQQRAVYRKRLLRLSGALASHTGFDVRMPAGGFYLWFDAEDGWAFAERMARMAGALVSPGDFYGAGGAHNVRLAVVQPDDRIELVIQRLGAN